MAEVIMIQGCQAGVGKSILVAALCRLLKQEGKTVAPFKAQHIAGNSAIIKEGLEMAKAQVMQAESAGVDPSVLMNPILLKPISDSRLRVIVNGEVRGDMELREYLAEREKYVGLVMNAFDTLCKENDVVIVEGSGTPTELYLQQDDLLNWGLASKMNIPVLLTGDYARGGVFAQLLGTIGLLEPEEKRLVKGMVINRFHGDADLLAPGFAEVEKRAGVPILGRLPMLWDPMLREGSLTEHLYREMNTAPAGQVDLAVIRLPHMSSYTDFTMLSSVNGASVRYVDSTENMGDPDLVFLPDTKNVMQDLTWLRETGMETEILKCRERGKAIFGICGGYQMLGLSVRDPEFVQEGGDKRGLGLLPMETYLSDNRIRTSVSGHVCRLEKTLEPLSGMSVEGFFIRMGQTVPMEEDMDPVSQYQNVDTGELLLDGAQRDNVYGTFLQGFFDKKETAESLVKLLAAKKGVSLNGQNTSTRESREQEYDHLADLLREHLNMEELHRIMKEGVR